MIYANLNHLGEKYEYPTAVFDLLQALKEMDLSQLPIGRTDYGEDGIYFNVFEVSSVDVVDDMRMSECHNTYVDVQVSLNGYEVYGFAPRGYEQELLEDRLDSEDALLFKGLANEVTIAANPLDVFVFFPNDVHRAYYQNETAPKSRRLVAKVPVELLK